MGSSHRPAAGDAPAASPGTAPTTPRDTPRTALSALRRRGFLTGAWPWRSLTHLLTTPAVALAVALPLGALGAPWIVLLARSVEVGPPPLGASAVLLVAGAVLVSALGPLVALPLARLERARLRLIDTRPVTSGHRVARTAGPGAWLRLRYSEPATWRELGYAGVLVSVMPLLSAVALAVPMLAIGLVASPAIVRAGAGPVALGLGEITTVAQAWPYAIAGLAALPASGYLLALAAAAQGVLARALLHDGGDDDLRARLVEVSRSRARLAGGFEAERRRIERDLHDGAQRRLVGLTLQLGLARLDVPPDSPAAGALDDAHAQAKLAMSELRELVRGIHPRVLVDRGLTAALRELADEAAVPVHLDVDLPPERRLASEVEHAVYFVVAEALTNVAKHSGAVAATVTGQLRSGVLVVEVRDDGRGGADPGSGSGLVGLADRVAVVEGRMLLSSPAGGPTVIRVELPCTLSEPSG